MIQSSATATLAGEYIAARTTECKKMGGLSITFSFCGKASISVVLLVIARCSRMIWTVDRHSRFETKVCLCGKTTDHEVREQNPFMIISKVMPYPNTRSVASCSSELNVPSCEC